MSTLEIKADLASAELLFQYRGADLQKPLEQLSAKLVEDAAKLRKTLDPKTANEPAPTITGLGKPNPEAEIKHKIKLALNDAFEAQLWADECKRVPDQVWRLNMSRLKWIYRYSAPE